MSTTTKNLSPSLVSRKLAKAGFIRARFGHSSIPGHKPVTVSGFTVERYYDGSVMVQHTRFAAELVAKYEEALEPEFTVRNYGSALFVSPKVGA